ncbi:MAG TPA: tripartite tricarboxylate transporter permease [bacterium]|nr:tripartite tricarboxylate transporter permease [bacterium]
MEMVFEGLLSLAHWQPILAIVSGLVIGSFIGATPGLTGNMALAITVPLTFKLPPVVGIPFLLAVYKGSLSGSSYSAILMNIPGTSAAVATVLDGYPMTQKGLALRAMKAGLYSSVAADTFSDLILIAFAFPLANAALNFGPAQKASLLVLALVLCGGLLGDSLAKGLLASMLGLLFSMVGLDPIVGRARLNIFGLGRMESIDLVAFLIGAFALAEVLMQIRKNTNQDIGSGKVSMDIGEQREGFTFRELFRYKKALIVSSIIGTVIGIVPGAGASIAGLLGYSTVKKISNEPEKFGTGHVEGVIAAEAASGAVSGANILPLLTLGIPGNAAAAILGAAFLLQGITPGPTIFVDSGPQMYSIFLAMILANALHVPLGSLVMKAFSKIRSIPFHILQPVIISLCILGSYSVNQRMLDVYIMLAIGVIAYLMRRVDIPVAPMVVAYILGRQTEMAIRQSLLISGGSLKIFIDNPLSLLFTSCTVLLLAWTLYVKCRRDASNKLHAGV